MNKSVKPINILLIEDNESDVRLVQEALKDCKLQNQLFVARDGVEVMDSLLKREKMSRCRKKMAEIKYHEDLKRIPVAILTTSSAEADVFKTYNMHANCYIVKPIYFNDFVRVVRSIESCWFSIIKISSGEK